MLNLLNSFGHRQSRIEGGHIIQPRRKPFLLFLHVSNCALGSSYRVGTWHLIDGNDGGGLAIQAAQHVVDLSAQFDARNIFQAQHRTVRLSAHHDLAKLLLGDQASLSTHGVGVFLSRRDRFTA